MITMAGGTLAVVCILAVVLLGLRRIVGLLGVGHRRLAVAPVVLRRRVPSVRDITHKGHR